MYLIMTVDGFQYYRLSNFDEIDALKLKIIGNCR